MPRIKKGAKARFYLNISKGTSQHTEIGGLLFVHIRDVLLKGLKALL